MDPPQSKQRLPVPQQSAVPYPVARMDPMECARNLAAINALQFQMMPAANVNTFWPQQTPFLAPNATGFMSGLLPMHSQGRHMTEM